MKQTVSYNKERPIRVCNVDEEGRFGGPERRIVLVARALKEYPVETHVVYPQIDSQRFGEELAKAGISSSALKITRLTKEKRVLIKYACCFLAEVARLYRFFRNNEFDLIHVNGSYQFKVALAGKLSGIPVVWHLNDTSIDRIVKVLAVCLARYCAAGLIVTGKRVYEYYVRGTALARKPFFEIQVPVDTAIFNPDLVVPDPRLMEARGAKVVTVSGINPTKGLEYFLEMAAKLLQIHSDIGFYVAGAGYASHTKYYRELKELVVCEGLSGDKVVFLGMINNVPSLLKAADIFVFTSVSESGPASVWEAMAMGKPIVTSDVGSVREYIEDSVSGFIVPIRDPGALAEKVEFLLSNPALAQKMGANALLVAQEKLDVRIAAQRHAFFYRKMQLLS